MKQSRSALRKTRHMSRPADHEGDDAVGRTIGTRLKTLYDEVANQPIPEKFLDLLDQLAATSVAPDPSREK